jgi:dTDP-4-dehydrorhamnose reductase
MTQLLITGGSGRLGRALIAAAQKLYPADLNVVAPSHSELDITDFRSCCAALHRYQPDVIIHAAAMVGLEVCEQSPQAAWLVNVIGTECLVMANLSRARFVYISTEYVFDGVAGGYDEWARPNPLSVYGQTKYAGELVARQHTNTLVLRAPFRYGPPWPYPKAFVDQWTSAVFVEKRAQQIIHVAGMSVFQHTLHLGGRAWTILDMARSVSPDVGEIRRAEVSNLLPGDTSLDDSQYKYLIKGNHGPLHLSA